MTDDSLSQQATPLIGRKEELAHVAARLDDPACRLLTIIGPGGVGKTRLALEAMVRAEDAFADGVYFVDLQPVSPAEFASAIADALPLTLSGREPPLAQLRHYLRDKELLLLLDNFEHLLGQATFLSDLLSQTQSVKLLLTSRQALNLQQEWRYPLRGLSVPPDTGKDDIDRYGAVQLFLERARRVRPDFSLEGKQSDVIEICRLVEGLPLALELAASWTRALSCAEIAVEVQHNLDFLSSSLRNVPERHRSMQAAFAQSWQLLSGEERDVFKRLSVFRGGFEAQAARAVAGASLSVLSSLLDKSLLRREANGRYAMHELLRQYAGENLAHSSRGDVANVRSRHCTYYLAFLAERNAEISGGLQLEAAAEIAAEFDNVRAAWQWAVEQEMVTEIADAAFALYYFCQFGSRYRLGAQMFARAAELLDEDSRVAQPERILMLTCLGWFHIRLGRFEVAQAVLTRAHALYQRLDDLPKLPYANDPSLGLGLLASMRGEYNKAERALKQAVRRNEQHGYLLNQETAHYLLVGVHLAQGQYEAAQHHARVAYAAAQALGDRWFMAYCLNGLGNVAAAKGESAAAASHYEASYAIREEFDDAEGMALALNHLGQVALQEGELIKAQRLLHESLDVYRGINDRGGLARTLHALGQTALARNDGQQARLSLQQALQIATDIQFVPLVLTIIVSAAEFALKSGLSEAAVAWLEFVQKHHRADHRVKARAERARVQFNGQPAEGPEAAPHDGKSWTLPEIIAAVQATLAIGPQEPKVGKASKNVDVSPLVEALTDREQEVLHFLSQGLTNREIAAELTVAVGTVKAHNHNIYGKLGVDNRVQAVSRARELGLI